jgi:hypothetical protein
MEDLVGLKIKVVGNDDYYAKTPMGTYLPGTDYQAMYDAPGSVSIRLAGVVRVKQDGGMGVLSPGVAYSDGLAQLVIDKAESSEIVAAQEASDTNVRKKDITRVFNAETFLIGLFSGTFGITLAWLATFPISTVIEDMTDLPDVAILNPLHAAILVAISTVLTVLGGWIPAVLASRKDPILALRSE